MGIGVFLDDTDESGFLGKKLVFILLQVSQGKAVGYRIIFTVSAVRDDNRVEQRAQDAVGGKRQGEFTFHAVKIMDC